MGHNGIGAEELQKDLEAYANPEYLYYPLNQRIVICHCMDGKGKYFRFYRCEEQIQKQQEELWKRRMEAAGIYREEKSCSFFRTEYAGNTLIPYRPEWIEGVDLGIAAERMAQPDEVRKVYERILEYQPVWLRGEADVVQNLLRFARDHKMPSVDSLRYLELVNGWKLDKKDLDFLKNCRGTVRQVYSFDWCGDFAFENMDGGMELLPDAGIWEICVDNMRCPEGEGELVVNMEQNQPMPVSCLRTGYQGRIRMNQATGKREIQLKCPDWEKESGDASKMILTVPVERINETIGNMIWQYQLETMENGYRAHLYLRPAYAGWKEEIEKLFLENLRAGQKVSWEFQFHETYF